MSAKSTKPRKRTLNIVTDANQPPSEERTLLHALDASDADGFQLSVGPQDTFSRALAVLQFVHASLTRGSQDGVILNDDELYGANIVLDLATSAISKIGYRALDILSNVPLSALPEGAMSNAEEAA